MVPRIGPSQALAELQFDNLENVVRSELKAGTPPLSIVKELRAGLETVGDRFHNGEYFIGELCLASEMMKGAMDILTPLLSAQNAVQSEGTVVLGAIMGDAHDFGKMIVSSLLVASGFKVHDLGVDVPPATFVDQALKYDAQVIGISALLSAVQQNIKAVVDELQARGLRDRFKVIVGGSAVTSRAVEMYGVDAAVNDASEGISIIKGWMKERSKCQ